MLVGKQYSLQPLTDIGSQSASSRPSGRHHDSTRLPAWPSPSVESECSEASFVRYRARARLRRLVRPQTDRGYDRKPEVLRVFKSRDSGVTNGCCYLQLNRNWSKSNAIHFRPRLAGPTTPSRDCPQLTLSSVIRAGLTPKLAAPMRTGDTSTSRS